MCCVPSRVQFIYGHIWYTASPLWMWRWRPPYLALWTYHTRAAQLTACDMFTRYSTASFKRVSSFMMLGVIINRFPNEVVLNFHVLFPSKMHDLKYNKTHHKTHFVSGASCYMFRHHSWHLTRSVSCDVFCCILVSALCWLANVRKWALRATQIFIKIGAGTVTGLRAGWSWVRISVGAGDFLHLQNIHPGSGAQSDYCSVGTAL